VDSYLICNIRNLKMLNDISNVDYYFIFCCFYHNVVHRLRYFRNFSARFLKYSIVDGCKKVCNAVDC
jgi:hypothetical protein